MPVAFTLRKWLVTDAEALVHSLNNHKITGNLRDGIPNPYTLEDAYAWIKKCNASEPQMNFAIDIDGIACGAIGITLMHDVYRKNAEIGYWLAAAYWNRGIMTAAIREVAAYAFEKFDINNLFACVFESNKASMRVLQKAGFKPEAVLKNWIIKNGLMMDEHRFVMQRIG